MPLSAAAKGRGRLTLHREKVCASTGMHKGNLATLVASWRICRREGLARWKAVLFFSCLHLRPCSCAVNVCAYQHCRLHVCVCAFLCVYLHRRVGACVVCPCRMCFGARVGLSFVRQCVCSYMSACFMRACLGASLCACMRSYVSVFSMCLSVERAERPSLAFSSSCLTEDRQVQRRGKEAL